MSSTVLLIEVTAEVKQGGEKTEFGFRKTTQVGYLHGTSAYPDKWVMRYEHTERPIEPGWYLLGAGSFVLGKWGPEVKNPDFVRLDDAVVQLGDFLAKAKSGAKVAA